MLNRLLPDSRTDPELAPFRAGLLFGFFNTLTWQIALGTPLVLFAEQLGATTFQAGLAYSFVFLLTPVQVLATVLLPRFGYKGLTLGGWGLRSFMLLIPLFLAPWAAWKGAQPWMITALIGSCFGFCLLRAIGMAASLPWFFAILPGAVRGRYFANDYLLSGVASVLTLLVCAGLFALLPIYPALFLQYLISVLGSAAAYGSLRKLPDGPVPAPISLRGVAAALPVHLGCPSTYRSYLMVTVVCYFCTTPLAPFTAYHLKATVGLAPGLIMLFEVLRYAGGVLGASALRRRVDKLGARPFLLSALGAYVVLGAYWLGFLRTGFGGSAGLLGAYFLFGAANACWMVGNLSYLPKITTVENRTITVTLQGALASLAGGVSVTAWGFVLRSSPEAVAAGAPATDPVAFQVMFGVVLVGSAWLSWWLSRLPAEQDADGAEPLMIGNALLRPHRAMGYLVNIIDPREAGKR
jgi:hypothetical protein